MPKKMSKEKAEKLTITLNFPPDCLEELRGAALIDGGNTLEELGRRLFIEYMIQFPRLFHEDYENKYWVDEQKKKSKAIVFVGD